ncbi:Sortase family protein [Pseudobutyrivibrio sp. UC1225]|uniref:sortase n=1 Tax=Pseudobutyrivibrio sp. UC1225 TaxID=1798185 RepID=UPI0008EFD1BD|nr:sortase [Pseudobutyrivibrio sp. UC1225]SFO17424.1 Sortase family protein [Pseudobutyrivibrio sp. UC1225]
MLGAWKKYLNYILIIVTGSMLILFIISNAISVTTVAEDGDLNESLADGLGSDENLSNPNGDVVLTSAGGGEDGGAQTPEPAPEPIPIPSDGGDPEDPTVTPVPEADPTPTPNPDDPEVTPTPNPDDPEVTPTPDPDDPEVTPTPDPEVTPTPEVNPTPEPGEEEEDNGCICTTHCTEDEVNSECPVCSEDYNECSPKEEDPEEGEEEEEECTCTALCNSAEFDETCPVCAKDFTKCAFKEEEEKECTCEYLCEEGEVDLSCECCAEDYTKCKGVEREYAAIIQYSIHGEEKTAKFLTLEEALNGAKAVADEVHSQEDSNYVPVIEIRDEIDVSSTITVENNCNFIIDVKGHRISVDSGAYLDFSSSSVTFRDSTTSGINYGGDNTRPGGVSGTSGQLFAGSDTLTFTTGYYNISSGVLCSGFSTVTVNDAFLINSSGSLFDNRTTFNVNNGFFVYDSLYKDGNEGSVVCPNSMVLMDKALSIGGYSVQGYGLCSAVFKVTLQMVGATDYYCSTFAEAFSTAESLSKSNDGAKTVIVINDTVVSSVAISQTYTLTGNGEGYDPVVQIDNINFTRGGAGTAGFDGTMFAVSGGELIFNDCTINGYISESQVAVGSMITVDSGATLSLIGSSGTGTVLTGNVALLGATAGDPAAGIYLKDGSRLRVNGYIVAHNNVCYSEVADPNGQIEGIRTDRNVYMEVNSAIVVDGALIKTESFLIGITMSTDDVDETQPIGSLSNDYYFGLAAAGISEVDLSAFYMDTSAAYFMDMDFDNNIITWSRGGSLLPEAGVFRLEYILLFMGLMGFIFRAIQEAKDERKEIVKYITVISLICLLAGAGFGSYHVYDEMKIIQRNNQVMENLTGNNSDGQVTSGDATFEQEVTPEESITIVEDTSTEKIVEEVAPNKSIVPADGREYIGVIEVERLGIKLPVLSSYTDADMKTTPCVYYGTRENGNLVIVGHNYNSQFGDFNLLDSREVITAKLTLVDGSEYEYTSKLMENLEPDQIDEMLTGDWDLTLFTCSYSGEKRIAIRFDLKR